MGLKKESKEELNEKSKYPGTFNWFFFFFRQNSNKKRDSLNQQKEDSS